jgi:hypothetical protein
VGLLEGAGGETSLALKARHGEESLLACLDEAALHLSRVRAAGVFAVIRWHLHSARHQLASSPARKGKQQLDEFLETELSHEPQVGFVVGVGANETSGVLLPIASSLVYRLFPEKIVVTGAVSSSAPGAAELDLAVQMTHQSAREALTLVENYLQSLCPNLNVPRILGEFLDGYSLHHQLLSASYSVGGPSAGFALTINTLSILLSIPVLNDFGITGAPWTKGAKRGEVGASVIIGGHRKKTEKVLQYLSRMYMPQQNYQDMEVEVLEAYRIEGRDIRGVRSFSALVPEVFFFGDLQQRRLTEFLRLRLEKDLTDGLHDGPSRRRQELEKLESDLRHQAEEEIRRRVEAVHETVKRGVAAYSSLEEIFHQPPIPVEKRDEAL